MQLIFRFLRKDATEIEAKHSIIATGSKPSNLPFIDLDKDTNVITSTEALKLKEIPKTFNCYWWWCYWFRTRTSI